MTPSSSSPNTPSRPRPAPPASEESPPPSPFSATPTSLHRPPLAHLASQTSLHRPLPPPPPPTLPSLSRPSQPLSTLSDTHANYVDLYRPDGSAYSAPRSGSGPSRSGDMQRSASAESPSSPTGKGKGREAMRRSRRSSVGSLQGVMDRDGASRGTGSLGNFDFLRRTSSRQSSGDTLPPIDDEAAGGTAQSAAQLAQLSWGSKWWPFSVVGPEGQPSSGPGTPGSTASAPAASGSVAAAKGAEAAANGGDSLGFLSLFAGKKTVQDAHAQAAEQARRDREEADLLEADVEELRRRMETPAAPEADEELPPLPPKRFSFEGKALPPSPQHDRGPPVASTSAASKAASFLPSLFSSTTTSPSTESASASLSSITAHAVAAEQAEAAAAASASSSSAKSPSSSGGSLLSSLTLANPFTSSSAGSLFSSAPFSSSASSTAASNATAAPRPPALAHTRQFSSSSSGASLWRRRSTGSTGGSGGEEGSSSQPDRRESDAKDKGPSKREVKGMVDESDKQAVEEGVEENDDMYSVLKDKYKAPRLPVVFCHGLFGFDYLGPQGIKPLKISYWIGVEEALQAMGVEVMIGRVPASASIEERAKVLCQLIGERFPGREVNLIGHSMGGLDGRYLISRLRPTNFKIASLTTISTPHRGSSFADFLLEDILGAEKVPAFLGVMRGLGVPGGGKAFDDLTTTKMARFNEETPDDPNVKYYSYGAEFVASWSNPFYIPYGIIAKREGPNDGLVSVQSAKWGEYKATLHNVNHLDLVGWTGKVRYGFAELLGRPIKFAPVSFYMTIAEQLSLEGF
ncbi:hypothetical protein JCM6882_004955 [Rhodosporidiobolus microsporus]